VTLSAAYSLMLLVPVILTVAVFGLLAALRDVPLGTLSAGEVGFALLVAVGVAGVPYIVMAVGLAIWAENRPAPAVRRAANLAPVILWLLVMLWSSSTIWRIRIPENPLSIREPFELFALISALVLGLGISLGITCAWGRALAEAS
jgi:uncharacterized membrane protein